MTQASATEDYTTTFDVERGPAEVFRAVNDVRGWWSEAVEGVTDRVGAEFEYRYQDVHRCRIQVTELVPAQKVAWLVRENYFDFVEDQTEWEGTRVLFEITETANGSEVRFTHQGLVPRFDCYQVCSNAWSGYIGGSLRSLIDTGKGQPNPKEDGVAPAHQDAATEVRDGRASDRDPA